MNFLSVAAPKTLYCPGELAAERRVFATIGHAFGETVLAQGALWHMLRPFGAIRQIGKTLTASAAWGGTQAVSGTG